MCVLYQFHMFSIMVFVDVLFVVSSVERCSQVQGRIGVVDGGRAQCGLYFSWLLGMGCWKLLGWLSRTGICQGIGFRASWQNKDTDRQQREPKCK